MYREVEKKNPTKSWSHFTQQNPPVLLKGEVDQPFFIVFLVFLL
jgi:hypothetical protein